MKITLKIFQILGCEKYWQPNTLYLFTIACYFNLLNSARMFLSNVAPDRISGTTEKDICSKIKSIITILDQNTAEMMAYIKKTNSGESDLKKAKNIMETNMETI